MTVNLTDEIERLRARCIGCGKCSKVCPALRHGGIDPMEVMMGGECDMSTCISCGNCSKVCRRTDPTTVMKDLIAMERDIHVSQTFRDTGYVMPPAEPVPEPRWAGGGVMVMPGCVAKGKLPHVIYAASVAMDAIGAGGDELPGNTCCMHPVQFREMPEPERKSYKTGMGDRSEGRHIVTLCAGCSEELSSSLVDAEHIIPFLASRIGSLPKLDEPMKVAIEPGCSAMPFKNEMRAVVEAMGCEVVNTSMGCCGKGTPEAGALMAEREAECEGADWIVVGCPMCLVKFDAQPDGIPAMHIAELVALASGDGKSLDHHRLRR